MKVRNALLSLAVIALPACASGGMNGEVDESTIRASSTVEGSMAGQRNVRALDVFTDANVAATATASNLDEIQTSQLALQKSQNAQVRQFAQMMVTEHTTLQQEHDAMLRQKDLTEMDNALSGTMKRNLPRTVEMLRGMNGMAFDMGYMMHQVHSHEMTLNTIETSLLPNVRDPQMRAMLQNRVRPAVAAHLQQARQILMSMHGGTHR